MAEGRYGFVEVAVGKEGNDTSVFFFYYVCRMTVCLISYDH